jgi:hypothetical protein
LRKRGFMPEVSAEIKRAKAWRATKLDVSRNPYKYVGGFGIIAIAIVIIYNQRKAK